MQDFVLLIKKSLSAWLADSADRQAAALAYYGILSLAPLLVIAVSVAGVFFGQADVQQQVVAEAENLLGSGSAELVKNFLTQTYNIDGGFVATVTSLLVLFIASTNLFYQLKTSLNYILDSNGKESSKFIHGVINFLKDRLLAAAMVIGVGVLFLITQILSAVITVMISLASNLPVNTSILLQILNLTASIGFSAIVISLIFRFLPDKRLAWREVWVGGIFSATLFALGQRVLSFYFEVGNVASGYGVAGSVIVVLIWIYFVASVLLFGAEVAQAYGEMSDNKESEDTSKKTNSDAISQST